MNIWIEIASTIILLLKEWNDYSRELAIPVLPSFMAVNKNKFV